MALLLTRAEDAGTCGLAEHLANGGYQALAKARAGAPEDVIQVLLDSGLRGRGGAGFPVARKWEMGLAQSNETKHVVVNGGEHEPGSRKDRFLVATMPHRVLEGAAICAFATGAKSIVLYLIEDMTDAIEAARRAIDEAVAGGQLAGLDVKIALAPTTYVAGEETAALEVIEGRKPWPRKKPPYPGQAGLYGQPTTVQNVETLAWVPGILTNGAAWFSPGAMLCTLDDSFAKPGIVEVPLGTTHGLRGRDARGPPGEGHSPGAVERLPPCLSLGHTHDPRGHARRWIEPGLRRLLGGRRGQLYRREGLEDR